MVRKGPEELRSQRWYPRLLIGAMALLLLAGWIDSAAAQSLWPRPGASHISRQIRPSRSRSAKPRKSAPQGPSVFSIAKACWSTALT